MSKTKKIILAFAVIFVAFVTLYLYDMTRFYDPYRNVTAEGKAMYRDFDVVAIEVTVDDKGGKLSEIGLDVETLGGFVVKDFEELFRRNLSDRELKISIFNQPYNLDNHPKALVISLHWTVRDNAAYVELRDNSTKEEKINVAQGSCYTAKIGSVDSYAPKYCSNVLTTVKRKIGGEIMKQEWKDLGGGALPYLGFPTEKAEVLVLFKGQGDLSGIVQNLKRWNKWYVF
jgi:hypothetical protein